MTRPLIIVGPFAFPTLKQAAEKAKSILHSSARDTFLSGPDLVFVRGLLERHPDATAKIGCGVRALEVRTLLYGAPGFWIVRTDGTGGDFSYKQCLPGIPPGHRSQVDRAMRMAVRHQTDGFKQAWFDRNADSTGTAVCPVSGRKMTWVEAETDHIDLFTDLKERWVVSAGGYPAIVVGDSTDHPGPAMSDAGQLDAWRSWHARNAALRVVHKDVNRARGAHRGLR